ncbi:bifunctional glutathionylspermidine amidase/synthase [Glaciecola sp. SC05]|uniref:bifunctional glutathionylspermidine amidase/synthase n=1 Tax=Glaciecola sp. SC05 TaxID=1987355 RepID=UPI00352832BE
MVSSKHPNSTKFGTLLGVAQGGVCSYSSDYDSADEKDYPNRTSYRSYFDGIYMGYKWQCVEFARRWLYVNRGYIFNDVSMAYEIFNLRSVREIKSNRLLPLNAFRNGSTQHPEPGAMLIWDEGGEFEHTGHVAIISEILPNAIRIVEQNMDFVPWQNGRNYSREISARIGAQGDYWLQCSSKSGRILGWMLQTEDDTEAEHTPEATPHLFNVQLAHAKAHERDTKPWLNIANHDEAAYVDMMKGHVLSSVVEDFHDYYEISETALEQLETATDELHGMFMHATDYVLQHPELLSTFGFPDVILPRIKQSWDNRLNQLITSRFDFAMTEKGLKVYEYNCDSASCYMEVGKIQGKWAEHLDLKRGKDAGESLFESLVDAWKASDAKGIIHVLQDTDPEEDYHALFMQEAIETAGFTCKRVIGLHDLHYNENNEIVDDDNVPLRWVWKTWAWETALEQLREDVSASECPPLADDIINTQPKLADVLLRKEIMVYEPMWTLIPSNKAILPVLWTLFPNHPWLLETDHSLSETLKKNGYVAKPIVGRCGANIRLVDKNNKVLATKEGAFGERDYVYQQLWPLPKVGKYYVQICTFTAAGNYAGSGVRVDASMIIGKDSDCMALRVQQDDEFASA